jgi:hypothetical protein
VVPKLEILSKLPEDSKFDQVRTWCRRALRALLLAGRFPWFAFFNTRLGLAIASTPKRNLLNHHLEILVNLLLYPLSREMGSGQPKPARRSQAYPF